MKKYIILVLFLFLSACSQKYTAGNSKTMIEHISRKIEISLPVQAIPNVDIDNPNSIYVLVNKKRPLTDSFVPDQLVTPNVLLMRDNLTLHQEAASALENMFNEASNQNINLALASAYRSYDYQANLYNNYVARDGEEAANRYSAKPGQSEHQTGLAADIVAESQECYIRNCFKDMEEGIWLKENAHYYGFILRYPEGKEEITGYIFEPWHYRYLGVEQATAIYESGLTMEEFYNIMDKKS